MHNEYKCN